MLTAATREGRDAHCSNQGRRWTELNRAGDPDSALREVQQAQGRKASFP